MTAPIAATNRPVATDEVRTRAEEQARVDRMVEAIRRLGAQLETTHRTLDEFVERLSVAAHDARESAGAPVPRTPAPDAHSRPTRPAVGTPVRRVEPVAAPEDDTASAPPAGLAAHVRAPGAAPEGPVTH